MQKKQHLLKLRILTGLIAILSMVCVLSSCSGKTGTATDESNYRVIKDMWDREVKVKKDIKTAVIMEWEGLATKSMKVFGLEKNIIGVDNSAKKNIFRKQIAPVIEKVPGVGSPYSGVNYEQVAKLKPDIVFMELWVTNQTEKDMHEAAIKKIEGLGIPGVYLI